MRFAFLDRQMHQSSNFSRAYTENDNFYVTIFL